MRTERDLPEAVGAYRVRPWDGASLGAAVGNKLLGSVEEAVRAVGLKDGDTISFHHAFREGDLAVGLVLAAIRRLGIKGLRFAPSAVVNLQNCSLADCVRDGTIDRVEASGIRGELGDCLLDGSLSLSRPAILRPHGARPRAITSGELDIDVAFIAASAADERGNCTGQLGANPCGSLGYAFVDAKYAKKVVVLTDTLVPYPCLPASIGQRYVDYVVKVDQIGDPAKIGAGAARLTKNPRDLAIAERVAELIAASSLFREGFSFQTGAGAISIACTKFLAGRMAGKKVTASFALGGITAAIIDMYDAGLVRAVECSQSFDAVAAKAILDRPGVAEIDNADYAGACAKGNFLDKLDFGVLGALEVDTGFNVNILTGASGRMLGGLGGGPDVAAQAAVPIIALPIIRGRIPSIVQRVQAVCTPGITVACVVTQAGTALNPRHPACPALREDLRRAGIKLSSIEELCELACSLTGKPQPLAYTDRVAAVVEYRDGSVLDVLRPYRSCS